jgi:peptidoglycan/LPS O-acetylase OafA/YrhL
MGRVESVVRVGIVSVVGAIGAAAGFQHTHSWAEANGQHGWLAWAVAVVIESMAIIAGLELRRAPGRFPVLVLVISFLLQMSAQVAEAPKTVQGWLLAATPALGFLVIVKLVMRPASSKPRLAEPAEVERVEPSAPVAAARTDRPELEKADEPARPGPTPVEARPSEQLSLAWPPRAS